MAQRGKRRVLMLSITPFKGGGETHDAKLAMLLAERYDVFAIVCNPWLQTQMESIGVKVTKIRAGFWLIRYCRCAVALLIACMNVRPCLVHLNGQGETYLAPLLRMLNVPIVIARHSLLYGHNSWLKQKLIDFCHRFGDRIICVSTAVKREMETIVPQSKLVTIPNWLLEHEVVGSRNRNPLHEPFRLLFVGRLVHIKGTADLIEAMKLLDGCELEIVGDGPERMRLEQLSLGLPVNFHGTVNDCTPYFDNADLLVFPSHMEGQGQAPIEAMARGLPCLVSDIEAAKETTDNGRFAGMFRCGDVQDLANQINRMRDSDMLRRLSQGGIQRVKDCYSVATIRPLYFKLFDSLVKENTCL